MEKLFNYQEIQEANISLAKQLNQVQKLKPMRTLFVGILNGGYRIISDVSKYTAFPAEIDFCQCKSYTGKTQGEIKFQRFDNKLHSQDANYQASLFDGIDSAGIRLVVFDDILDSGRTALKVVEEYSKILNIKDAVLVTYARRKNAQQDLDLLEGIYSNIFTAFIIDDEWLIGCGMDDEAGNSRNLPYICKV